MIEPLGDAMHDRILQRVVMQDGRIDEGRELGLAPDDLLGLAADARPDRIDLVERSGVSTCCWAMIGLHTLRHSRELSIFGPAMDHTSI